MPLERRYKADRVFQTKSLTSMWDTDIIDGHIDSLEGSRYAQVFSNETYFSKIYLMANKSDLGQSLKAFVMELGVFEELTVDG